MDNYTRSLGAMVVMGNVVSSVVVAGVVASVDMMIGMGIGRASPGPLFTGTAIAYCGGLEVVTCGRMTKILVLGGRRCRIFLVP